jgi:hypothetical protein
MKTPAFLALTLAALSLGACGQDTFHTVDYQIAPPAGMACPLNSGTMTFLNGKMEPLYTASVNIPGAQAIHIRDVEANTVRTSWVDGQWHSPLEFAAVKFDCDAGQLVVQQPLNWGSGNQVNLPGLVLEYKPTMVPPPPPPPVDTDKDGYPDSIDQCPDQPAGSNPDPNRVGCPGALVGDCLSPSGHYDDVKDPNSQTNHCLPITGALSGHGKWFMDKDAKAPKTCIRALMTGMIDYKVNLNDVNSDGSPMKAVKSLDFTANTETTWICDNDSFPKTSGIIWANQTANMTGFEAWTAQYGFKALCTSYMGFDQSTCDLQTGVNP